jgi:hypothetical protein
MVVGWLALAVSVVACAITIRREYRDRQKNQLKELAMELQDIQKAANQLITELRNPRKHEDNKLWLEDIANQVLIGKHETESDKLNVGVEIKKSSSDVDIKNTDELMSYYKNNEFVYYNIKIGNIDELYTTGRTVNLHTPIGYSARIYEKTSKIEQEYSDTINELDGEFLDDLEEVLDEIVRSASDHAVNDYPWFEITVSRYDTADEISTHVFETVFHYPGMEKDLENLSEEIERIEDYRTTVLQASY